MALSTLKQCKLCRIVNNCEFLEQGLNHFLRFSSTADVQMFGSVFWEVEGSASFYCSPSLPIGWLLRRSTLSWRWNRHRPYQLQVNFDETIVGAVFVLRKTNKLFRDRMITERTGGMKKNRHNVKM